MPNNPKVGVVGPFHQARAHAKPWLQSFENQTYTNFKLFVIDDASSDGTARELETNGKLFAERFELIALLKNVGPSAARNLAIRKALEQGCELILLLDCDCRISPDWISRHVEFHEKNEAISIMGGAIAGTASSLIGKADGFCSWFTAVPNAAPGEVKKLHLSSTNMSLKRHVFGKIGFFDEHLATGEDVAFCRKAQKGGLRLFFQSDIVSVHLDRNGANDARKHHFRWGLHSYTLSLQQHGGYYGALKYFKTKWPVMGLVPVIAALNTALILYKYTFRKPTVWLFVPWIIYLKWWNAVGVYRGFRKPELCLRQSN